MGIKHNGKKWVAYFDKMKIGEFNSEAEAVAARNKEYSKHDRYAGVAKSGNKLIAQMRLNGKQEIIGYYNTFEEAVDVIKQVELSDNPMKTVKAIRDTKTSIKILTSKYLGIKHDGKKWLAKFGNKNIGEFDS